MAGNEENTRVSVNKYMWWVHKRIPSSTSILRLVRSSYTNCASKSSVSCLFYILGYYIPLSDPLRTDFLRKFFFTKVMSSSIVKRARDCWPFCSDILLFLLVHAKSCWLRERCEERKHLLGPALGRLLFRKNNVRAQCKPKTPRAAWVLWVWCLKPLEKPIALGPPILKPYWPNW